MPYSKRSGKIKPFSYSYIRNEFGERFQLKNAFKLITDQKIGYNPEFGIDEGLKITTEWFKKEFVN